MPFFRTTHNIFVDKGEYFNADWFDSDTLVLPPKLDWDHKKELQIEDIDLWEVILEYSAGIRLYAAWQPYAEFYLLTDSYNTIETYYGKGALKTVIKRLNELEISHSLNKIWIEPEDMWLYE